MGIGFWLWSRTAADNDDIDSGVNWREGQAPSTINNSGRGMMASLAAWRDDVAGMIDTGGGSTAYTVASFQTFSALTDGVVVAFVPHTTSGAVPTLNVDGLGAKPLRGASGTDLIAGVLSQGTPYVARYKSSTQEWLLHGFFARPDGAQIGSGMIWVGSSAPNSSWVFPFGQALSRTTYATLFSLCGTTYGAGDGTTTFNVPDIRGRAIFGLDNMGGSTVGRVTNAGSGITGTTRGAAGGQENLTLDSSKIPSLNFSLAAASHQHSVPNRSSTTIIQQGGPGADINIVWFGDGSVSSGASGSLNVTGTVGQASPGAITNMPPAIVLPYIIRAL